MKTTIISNTEFDRLIGIRISTTNTVDVYRPVCSGSKKMRHDYVIEHTKNGNEYKKFSSLEEALKCDLAMRNCDLPKFIYKFIQVDGKLMVELTSLDEK